MKENKKIFIIAAICLTALIILSFAGCSSNMQGSKTTQAAVADAGSNPNQVICKSNKFNPAALTVKAGTTVTWVNEDSYIHTVTSGTSPSDRSGLFDSGNLNGGDTFSFTFSEAGTYDYFCVPHYSLGMIGKIIVTN